MRASIMQVFSICQMIENWMIAKATVIPLTLGVVLLRDTEKFMV